MALATVVIPTHDAEATIGAQLAALCTQVDAPEFDVVVALNRCTDRSEAVAESYRGRLPLRVIRADEAQGANHARNAGAFASDAPLLLFCDADDEVGTSWVAEMAAALSTGGADLVGGRLVVNRTTLPDWLYRVRYRAIDGTTLTPYGRGMMFPIGAAFGCRREAFDAVGGFDEALDQGGADEIDFAVRVLRAGFRIGEAPLATVSYRPRPSARAALRQARGYARGAAILKAKEGRLERLGRVQVVWKTAKTAAALVTSGTARRPRDVLFRTLVRYHYANEERRLAQGPFGDGSPASCAVDDFVEPLGTPVIGGLAMRAPAAREASNAASSAQPTSLALLEAVVPPGGIVVDVGAGVGAFSVAGAKVVGPHGRVIAVEPDAATRVHLMENLRRHRVADRVEVEQDALGATTCTLASALSPDRTPGRQVDLVKVHTDVLQQRVVAVLGQLIAPRAGWALWFVEDERTGAHRRLRSADELTRVITTHPGNLLAVPDDRAAKLERALGAIERSS